MLPLSLRLVIEKLPRMLFFPPFLFCDENKETITNDFFFF